MVSFQIKKLQLIESILEYIYKNKKNIVNDDNNKYNFLGVI